MAGVWRKQPFVTRGQDTCLGHDMDGRSQVREEHRRAEILGGQKSQSLQNSERPFEPFKQEDLIFALEEAC